MHMRVNFSQTPKSRCSWVRKIAPPITYMKLTNKHNDFRIVNILSQTVCQFQRLLNQYFALMFSKWRFSLLLFTPVSVIYGTGWKLCLTDTMPKKIAWFCTSSQHKYLHCDYIHIVMMGTDLSPTTSVIWHPSLNRSL